MAKRAISRLPNTIDLRNTLKHFKGYYCPDKIAIQHTHGNRKSVSPTKELK